MPAFFLPPLIALAASSSAAGLQAVVEHGSVGDSFNSVPASLGGSGAWCRLTDACWPTRRKIRDLGKACDGAVKTARDGVSFIDGVHMKNLRFNSTLPGILVEAESLNDIQQALSFAKKYNIRMVVLSTGHDYDGRSTAPSSLMLSMKNLNKIVPVTMDMHDGKPNATLIRVETGNYFQRLYEFADSINGTSGERLVVVGGSDGSVGIGGWTMGGGHSALSRLYGLGVDNVVEFEVVVASGAIVVANKDRNTELFWALRGGGGGTFGIVTNMTVLLRPDPGELTVLTQACPKWSTAANPTIGAAAARALQEVIANAPDNLSGYPQFLNPDRMSGIGMAWALLYFGNKTDAQQHLAPLLDPELSKDGGCYHAFESIPRYYLYTKSLPIAHDRALYMSSSVFNAESLNEKDALVKAANWVFTNNISEQVPYIPNFGTGCSINFGTGGAAARVDPNATSVHPSFRTGICELSCYANWDGNRGYPEVNVLMDEWANSELNPLGDGAAYFNEPQSDRMDWKAAFWGGEDRYARLLEVKQQYDPTGFFSCHHCVGWAAI